jgi:hypothetical protein
VDSNDYTLTVGKTNPGLFTIAASGQGSGALLDKNYAVVSPANPVAMHATANSDPVMIYMTGLGEPASAADNTANTPPAAWSTDCIGVDKYVASLIGATGVDPTTVDGLIIQSAMINTGRLVPCLDSTAQLPEVWIGGVKASVTYAGWVADSIAGLYQVNATLPKTGSTYFAAGATCTTADNGTSIGTITTAQELPLCIKTKDGKYTQAGVTIAVAPRLDVSQPSAVTGTPAVLPEKVYVPDPADATTKVTAAEGSGPYTFAITSGTLPTGLAMNTSGQFTGTPAPGSAGSYPITVTAKDNNTPAMTGTVSFVIKVDNGLNMSTSSVNTATGAGTIVATGGTLPYKYTIDTSKSDAVPAGVGVNADTGVVTGPSASSTAKLVFLATDANGVTGTVTFTLAVTIP